MLFALAALAAIGLAAMHTERAALLREYEIRMAAVMDLRRDYLREQIEQLRSHARFLAAVPPAQGVLRTANGEFDTLNQSSAAAWRQRLTKIFSSYEAANPLVSRLRLLKFGPDGPRVVHADHTEIAGPGSDPGQHGVLQGRPYFDDLQRLRPGDVSVSELSRGLDGRPTLRAAAPVIETDGTPAGAVVVNLDATALLNTARANMLARYRIYVTDAHGAYLLHPDPARILPDDAAQRWQQDFTPAAEDSRGDGVLRSYMTSSGEMYVVSRRITLDERASERALIVHMALPARYVAGEARRYSLRVVGFAIVGALCAAVLALAARWRIQRATARQARLATLVEQANDAMIGKTLDGVVTDWNPAAQRLFGYTAEEAIGRTLLELIVAPTHASEERDILRCIARGETVPHFETRRHDRNGRVLDVSVTVAPVFAADGRVVGACKTVRDISAEKETLRKLADTQAQLRLTTQANGISLWEWSARDCDMRWDDTMAILYGREPGAFEAGYAAWQSAIHPEDRAAAAAALTRTATTLRPLDTRFRILWPNGSIRHLRTKGSAVLDGATGTPRILGTAYDITDEIERAQEREHLNSSLEQQVAARTAELRELTSLQGAILTDAAVSIIATDIEGVITLFNPAAEQLLGYRADQVVGRITPAHFHDPDEVAARAIQLGIELGVPVEAGFETFVAKARSGVTDIHEWTYLRSDGMRVPVQLSVTALRDDDGKLSGYLGMAIDQTERRTRDRALQARTAEAEQATQAKSQFLANMSHEIRSPMNAILGMLQLLQKTDLPPRAADYTTKAYGATQALLRLLNDILDFSKIEAGKIAIEHAPFTIDAVMRDVSDFAAMSLGGKPVELIFSIDPMLPATLYGDMFRLRQVLLNLVGNAIKFTAAGAVQVTIRETAFQLGESRLEFTVSDTGIGIAADKLASIFEGFSQAEASTTRTYGGTGLGLAISQRLVALMGGRLDVESETGRGSLFRFALTMRAERSSGILPPAGGGALRVLFADDNEAARTTMVHMARALGWDADCVATGADALSLLAKEVQRYDVVFIDWDMPQLDGWETADRIRQLAPHAASAIVLMAAQHRESLLERADSAPALIQDILAKPATVTMLAESALRALDRFDNRPAATAVITGRLTGFRLLVVDDTPINQEIASELLGGEGALITIAASGREAIELASAGAVRFDGILMDIQMPEMDGFETTLRLRELPALDATPIIAMTANAMESDRIACIEAGMSGHIPKPNDLDLVVETVRKLCGHGSAAALSYDGRPEGDGRLIDLGGVLRRLGGDRRLFSSIANSFINASARHAAEIETALREGDTSRTLQVLHTVKGDAASVGQHLLSDACGTLEKQLNKNGRLDDPHGALTLLQQLLLDGNEMLRTLLADQMRDDFDHRSLH